MYIHAPSPQVEAKFVEIIANLAQEQNAVDGIIDFTQQDIINRADGLIRTSPTMSGIMNYYKEKGLVERIQKGTPAVPSKWDMSKLLAKAGKSTAITTEEKAKEIYHAVQEPNQVEQKHEEIAEESKENQETINEISTTLATMMEYIKSLPDELLPTIQTFSAKVDDLDDGKLKELELKYKDLVDKYENEKASLNQEIEQLKRELQDAKDATPSFSEHRIYRSRNYIIDEIDRYFAQPGWARKGKAEHVQMVIHNHLDNIMKELGIQEPTGV